MTMMEWLAKKLALHEIRFDAHDRRVICFAHVIDLCSGQAIRAASGGVEHVDVSSSSSSDAGASDPIAIAYAAVWAIWGPGPCREAFNKVIKDGNASGWFKRGDLEPPETIQLKELQLIQDVRTRWDSVFHMLNRLREMRPV